MKSALLTSVRECKSHLVPTTRMATLLDPCTKAMEGISEQDQKSAWKSLKENLILNQGNQERPEAAAASVQPTSASDLSSLSLLQRVRQAMDNPLTPDSQPVPQAPTTSPIIHELKAYMAAEGIPFASYRSSIDWWSANQSRFPNIARLAKAYLVIPATSSASEVVFSVMGICSPKACNRKLPAHLGAEVFLRSNVEFVIPRSPEFQAEVNAVLAIKE